MSNKITASIHFSFKGERHSPSVELDIDAHMQSAGCLPNLYPLIAKKNGYDLYSYEYEMMQAEMISFSLAEGLIADFVEQGKLNSKAFEDAWHTAQSLKQLSLIAKEHMNIEKLAEQPDLQAALLAAYNLGREKK